MEDVERGKRSSKFLVVFLGLTCLLTSSWQADRLESQMRDMLKTQEGMDLRLEQRDGAQLAALSLQMQELSGIKGRGGREGP